MRVFKVLAVTHILAFLLPVALFALAFGWLVAAPAIEAGPLIFTCISEPRADGLTVYGCFGAWK